MWGAISYAGLGPLYRIPGRLTAEGYKEICDNVLLPYAVNGPFPDGCFYFQHDGCPVHTAAVVQENLTNSGIAQLEWPSRSPDLNIIENVWGIMKAKLARLQLGRCDQEALWEAVNAEWNRIREDTTLVESLYESLPRRIAEAKKRAGGAIKY